MEDQGGVGSIRIDKLTDSNFYVWKQKIQLLLALRDVDEYIVAGRVPSEKHAEERKKWIRGDSKAKALIGLSLSNEPLSMYVMLILHMRCGKPLSTCLRGTLC